MNDRIRSGVYPCENVLVIADCGKRDREKFPLDGSIHHFEPNVRKDRRAGNMCQSNMRYA